MALTGIEIYKHLPKTNCKKCGFPTCLAFAMKLSQKAAELSACPDVSEEAKQALDAASRPPIRLVTIGGGEKKIEVGNETVLFRHEKTFFHPPGLVVRLKDTLPLEVAAHLAREVAEYKVDRVGREIALDGVAIENASGDRSAFSQCVEAVASQDELALILISTDPAAVEAALETTAERHPLIYAAIKENASAMAQLSTKYQCPLAVYSEAGLEGLAQLVEEVTKAGAEDIVLDPGARGLADSLAALTQLRRLALQKNFRPLGYPIITFPGERAASVEEELALAGQHIAKYAGIVVLDHFSPALAYPLLTLRMDIYTDPQKPIQVQPGVYPIGQPKETSPLLCTTNFSLTYFSVAGEVDSGGVPSWLLIVETDGQSVLTAWAAGKFDGEKIAKAVKASDAEGRISHRSLVLPGHVAVLRGEVEEELPGWKIMVGPRDAVDLGSYLRQVWNPN